MFYEGKTVLTLRSNIEVTSCPNQANIECKLNWIKLLYQFIISQLKMGWKKEGGLFKGLIFSMCKSNSALKQIRGSSIRSDRP